MVKPGRLVAGKALGIATAVGVVLALAYVFRKSQAGSLTLASLTGAGKFGGEALLAPIQGLISGVAAGVGGLTQEGAKIGANLGSFADAIAAGNFQSIADGSFTTKYGGAGPAPSPAPKPQDTKDTFMSGTDKGIDKTSILSKIQPQGMILDIKKTFTPSAIQNRIKASNIRAQTQTAANKFGGFGSAIAQEQALRAAIEAQRKLTPQFFR